MTKFAARAYLRWIGLCLKANMIAFFVVGCFR